MRSIVFSLLAVLLSQAAMAQTAPYDVYPEATALYYRVRYEASTQPGELVFGANYTVWIPPGVKQLRGVVVHQHGCGEGSCKSGLTGAYDLHWQALARRHNCALLAPAFEQPEKANCQLWCDPRNGSDASFQRALNDLAKLSGHPELATVPWALWGHSGGGHWAGGMVFLHPERVVAAWLRSGVPPLQPAANKPNPYSVTKAALQVPILCNLGIKEGVSVKDGPFAGVWAGVEPFFHTLRKQGALIAVAIDPLSSHECGNQRYLAIPWLDACLEARLPKRHDQPLRAFPKRKVWLAPTNSLQASPSTEFKGDALKANWLPNERIARLWEHYVKDTAVPDTTPPPEPHHLQIQNNELTWDADADVQSGLAGFIIERDGQLLARIPAKPSNPYGRPVFQGLQYSDTPPQLLALMRFQDLTASPDRKHRYRVIAVNTVGLRSRSR